MTPFSSSFSKHFPWMRPGFSFQTHFSLEQNNLPQSSSSSGGRSGVRQGIPYKMNFVIEQQQNEKIIKVIVMDNFTYWDATIFLQILCSKVRVLYVSLNISTSGSFGSRIVILLCFLFTHIVVSISINKQAFYIASKPII